MAFEYRFNAIRFLLKIEPLRFKPSEKTEPFRFKNSSGWFCGLYKIFIRPASFWNLFQLFTTPFWCLNQSPIII